MKKTTKLFATFITLSLMFIVACDAPTPPPSNGSNSYSTQPTVNTTTSKLTTTSVAKQETAEWPYNVRVQVEATDMVMDERMLNKNYYVVLDLSGSMRESGNAGSYGTKLAAAKASLEKFSQVVPVDANLGLMAFEGNNIYEVVPLGIGNREEFVTRLMQMEPGEGTPLSSAVEAGYRKLSEQGKKQLGYGTFTLVIVTDGEANLGYDPTDEVEEIVSSSPVQVHAIGFGVGSGHSLNMPGRTTYKSANNPEQLEDGLKDVLAESEGFQDSADFKQ